MHMFLVVLHFEVFFGFEYNTNGWIAKNEECIYTIYQFVNIRGVTWNVINLITFYRMMFLIKFKKGMYNLVNILQVFDQPKHDQ